MDRLLITGGNKLNGQVQISGAKNAALAILSAALLTEEVTVIENLPDIEDVRSLVKAMELIGAKCTFIDKNTLKVDAKGDLSHSATYESMSKIRASYYLLGALLGRYKNAKVALPGGCDFGTRPIDQHIKGFEALGAKITLEHGMICARCEKLVGSSIYLDVVSVGATINIMLAAVYAEGITTIENAAKEPHVVDTANFLNILGAKIKGAGTDVIRIVGVTSLHGGEYAVIPDQIEAGTYMIAAAATGGDVTISNIIPKHMDSLSAKLLEMNCKVIEGGDYIRVVGTDTMVSTNVKTMVYPGFPTDLQPQMTALLCVANGKGMMSETVFDNRFQYVSELNRLGCKVTVQGRTAMVEGGHKMTSTEVTPTDLRAGAALIIAGLVAEGETIITDMNFVDRGYEDFEGKLLKLGAKIKRESKQ